MLNFMWSGSRYWLRFCHNDRLRPNCTKKVKPYAELYVFKEKLKKGFQIEWLGGVWEVQCTVAISYHIWKELSYYFCYKIASSADQSNTWNRTEMKLSNAVLKLSAPIYQELRPAMLIILWRSGVNIFLQNLLYVSARCQQLHGTRFLLICIALFRVLYFWTFRFQQGRLGKQRIFSNCLFLPTLTVLVDKYRFAINRVFYRTVFTIILFTAHCLSSFTLGVVC